MANTISTGGACIPCTIQRQMTQWSDSRNHLLDDLLRDAIIVSVAQCIGVAPGQFVAIVALTQLSETCTMPTCACGLATGASACGSARVFTGCTMPSAWAMNPCPAWAGHGPAWLGGRNFGVLLPGGTCCLARPIFEHRYQPTGCATNSNRGPMAVRDYGRGFGRSNGAAPVAPGGAWLRGSRAMLAGMGPLLDSFWRAVGYCLMPRIIVCISLLPLILITLVAGRAHFIGQPPVAWTQASWRVMANWLQLLGAGCTALAWTTCP